MILGRIAVGVIIFAVIAVSYFIVESTLYNWDFLVILIVIGVPALFTAMALYILI